jgi:peptide/nickel transport system substrate-binding protein
MPQGGRAHPWWSGELSRRDVLKAGAVGGIGAAGLLQMRPSIRPVLAQGGQPKPGGELVVRSRAVRGLDPHFETWETTLQVVHQAYNALIKFNHDGTKILPDLAESWGQTDELTYVFRLRQGVRFHDVPPVNGRELTSDDVKYSIERQMTDQPGRFQHAYFFLGKLASIDTPDQYTVVFKTKEPYAPFMNYLASPWTVIVAREVVEKHGDLQRHAIGTGPFIMKEYRRDQEAIFVKNPHYFKKDLPYLDEVRIQYIIDPAAATAAFRGQQADISPLEFADVDSIKASDPGIHIAEILSMFPVVLRTQPYDDQRPLKPPFTEKKARQAIQATLKPEEFIDISRSGWGVPMVGPIPPNRKPWALPASDRPEYNPQQAKQWLTEAGYPHGFEVELIVGAPMTM